MGKLRPDERLEDVRTVVDFWRSLALAPQRRRHAGLQRGRRVNKRYLPADVVDEDGVAWLRAPLDPTSAKASSGSATVSSYAFCTSAIPGSASATPATTNELSDGRHAIVRAYLLLGAPAPGLPLGRTS